MAVDPNDIVAFSIDRAFEHHMRQLFTKMATQFEGSHSESARASFRKQLRSALDARSEMQAIAKEI